MVGNMAEGEGWLLLIEVPAHTHTYARVYTHVRASPHISAEGSFALYKSVNVIVFCQVCVLQTFLHLGCFHIRYFILLLTVLRSTWDLSSPTRG